MSERNLIVWQSKPDQDRLRKSGYNFQIAKSVSTAPGGPLSYNVVWKSRGIAQKSSISWRAVYALNWTPYIPAAGANVNVGGHWQQCNKGDVFDLDNNGFWRRSGEAQAPEFLKVGKVHYSYPDTPGIHIVVGVLSASGDYDSIYVDPTALSLGSTAIYQPQEKVQFWYEVGSKASTMISSAKAQVGEIDFSDDKPLTGRYTWYTTFLDTKGEWDHSQIDPVPS
ncbi:hypothetical protein MMC19_001650 [Ptychographa xylographoides]|nr:hypothetical protein [Ptychographa xylographoides]